MELHLGFHEHLLGFFLSVMLIVFTAKQPENRLTAVAPCCKLFQSHILHEVPIYFQFVGPIHTLNQAIKSLRSVIRIHIYCLRSLQNIWLSQCCVFLSSRDSTGTYPALVSTNESIAEQMLTVKQADES